jgi:hypothetical protein
VIDFVRTSAYHEGESVLYKDVPPERILFEDYAPQELNSALYEVATKRVGRFGERLETLEKHLAESQRSFQNTAENRFGLLQTRIDSFVLIVFSVLAVLFAAVTIFVTRAEQFSLWNPALFLISLTAIFISVSAWMRADFPGRTIRYIVQVIVVLFLVFATAHHIWSVAPVQRQINDLRRDVDLLKKEKPLSPPIIVLPNPTQPTSSGSGRKTETKK